MPLLVTTQEGVQSPLSGVGILGKETDPRRETGKFLDQKRPSGKRKPLSVGANCPVFAGLRRTGVSRLGVSR